VPHCHTLGLRIITIISIAIYAYKTSVKGIFHSQITLPSKRQPGRALSAGERDFLQFRRGIGVELHAFGQLGQQLKWQASLALSVRATPKAVSLLTYESRRLATFATISMAT
jgi:hypothetical protein